MFGFGGGWGLLIFEALGLGLRVWGFGFCVGVLDFLVFELRLEDNLRFSPGLYDKKCSS